MAQEGAPTSLTVNRTNFFVLVAPPGGGQPQQALEVAKETPDYSSVDFPISKVEKLTLKNSDGERLTFFIYNCGLWLGLAFIIAAAATQDEDLSFPFYLTGGIVGGLALIQYLRQAMTFDAFTGQKWLTEKEAEALFEHAEKEHPEVAQNIQCSHRIRIDHEKSVEYRKITTYRGTELKEFTSQYDFSPKVKFSGKGHRQSSAFLKIYTKQNYDCLDDETKASFQKQERDFIMVNKDRDEIYDYHESYSVPSLPKVVLVNRRYRRRETGAGRPCWYNPCWYFCCVLCAFGYCWVSFVDHCCATEMVFPSLKLLSVKPKEESLEEALDKQKLSRVNVIL